MKGTSGPRQSEPPHQVVRDDGVGGQCLVSDGEIQEGLAVLARRSGCLSRAAEDSAGDSRTALVGASRRWPG